MEEKSLQETVNELCEELDKMTDEEFIEDLKNHGFDFEDFFKLKLSAELDDFPENEEFITKCLNVFEVSYKYLYEYDVQDMNCSHCAYLRKPYECFNFGCEGGIHKWYKRQGLI